MKPAAYWIEKIGMLKHPEGGWYKEIYRAEELVRAEALPPRYQTARRFSTSIYFMLEKLDRSVFHRIQSDEIWHYYTGTTAICMSIITPEGNITHHLIGNNPDKNEVFQLVIPKNCWFGAHLQDTDGYALIGCTVSPGFEFDDFEIGRRDDLIQLYPQHRDIIEKLT